MSQQDTFQALDISQLKESTRNELHKRLAYVQAVELAQCSLTEQQLRPLVLSVSKLRDEEPPGWYTVYRWVEKFRSGGCKPEVLVPYRRSGKQRKSRLDPRGEEFLTEPIQSVYLNRRKCSKREVWRFLQSEIHYHN